MSETKLADLSVEDRTEYISDMCVLAQHIKDLTLKLQIKKGAVKQYMEEEGVDRIPTECGTVLYMAYDKDLLNKDKTLHTIEEINAKNKNALNMEDFTRTVGVVFPLIKINDIQREEIYYRMNNKGMEV
jgi:hypothetical protein